MHDPLDEHTHVGILEVRNSSPAALAMRKERVGVAGDLFDEGVAMTAEQWHGLVRRFRSCTGDDPAGLCATLLVMRPSIAVRWVTAENLP